MAVAFEPVLSPRYIPSSRKAARRILFLSLHPLAGVGGGERYSLDTIRSIGLCGDQCSAYAAASRLPPRQPYADRMNTSFVKILPGSAASFGPVISLRDLLMDLSSYDAVVVHQFLSNDIVFDLVGDMASDQSLILTNLGHEPLDAEFKACFQPTPSSWFVEISAFSASRSMQFSRQSVGISAGIWRKDIAPAPPVAPALTGRLCSVGRVLPHKGFETTIAGLPEGCSLTIVGPGHEDRRYVRYLRSLRHAGPVEFLGQVSEEEKRSVIGNCDALIASSHHKLYDGRTIPQPELLGLVIFEALARFTMPITSNIPSFREVMANLGLSDFTFEEDDAAGLREVIGRYRATPPAERADRLRDARRRMESSYLWDDLWSRIKRQVPL
ncbi:MAG TPA: glycosyltransferase [Bryobacteraceae bacterium]|nr:glycosyltransferase [Bryobacteraceae bacterium]